MRSILKIKDLHDRKDRIKKYKKALAETQRPQSFKKIL